MDYHIIGDVHGLYDELVALIQALGVKSGDKVIFAGDLLDKGPDSDKVVSYVRTIENSTGIRGNHEDTHIRYWSNMDSRPGVARSMAERRPILSTTEALLSEADKDFIRQTVPFVRIPEHGILVVHGGISPTWEVFPETVEETKTYAGKARHSFEKIYRIRRVHRESFAMLKLGEATADDPFWAEIYDGRFGHVVFGHEVFDEVREFPHATGIDTGAVVGGKLTAMTISSDGERTFTSVPGRKFTNRLPFP